MDNEAAKKAQTIVKKLLENDSFSQWMGVDVVSVGEGSCKISCEVSEPMLNGYRVTHGGILFSLADTALAFSAATFGQIAPVVEHSISFTKTAVLYDILFAEATVVHQSHKLFTGTVQIMNGRNQLLAITKGSLYKKSDEITFP
ncbi:MAG: hotdog fold thioesterase [Balneolaceae bacterium]|nr:MAG: hotdog fold thioesterase [Balneolaceae bacterium]